MTENIAIMRVDDIRQVVEEVLAEWASKNAPQAQPVNERKYVYGLRGIRNLFNVSHVTAQAYKNTFLKPAIKQHGKKIIVDAELALELFNQQNK